MVTKSNRTGGKISKEKNRRIKEYTRLKTCFDIAKEREELQECENCYQRGERLFEQEHERWQDLGKQLEEKGYSLEQMKGLKEYYQQEISLLWEKEKAAAKEERTAKRVLEELLSNRKDKTANRKKEERREEIKKKNRNRESDRQPLR